MAFNPANNDAIRAEFDNLYKHWSTPQSVAAFAAQTAAPLNDSIYIERHAAIKRLADKTPGAYDGTMLDICCGAGNSMRYWPNKRVLGVDISPVAIGQAQDLYPDSQWVVGDVETFKLPKLPAKYPVSCIVNSESLEHWIDPSIGMKNIRSQVKTGTPMILSTPNRDSVHCRMHRYLGLGEPPVSCDQHVREFGYDELIALAPSWGWTFDGGEESCQLFAVWACEAAVGHTVRLVTDNNVEAVKMFAEIGRCLPAKYAFCMVLRFRAS